MSGTTPISPLGTAGLTVDDVRATVELWRSRTQVRCQPTVSASDLEWLSGRVRALTDVLSLLDGETPPGASPPDPLEAPAGPRVRQAIR